MPKKIAVFIASPMEINKKTVAAAIPGVETFYTGRGKVRAAENVLISELIKTLLMDA